MTAALVYGAVAAWIYAAGYVSGYVTRWAQSLRSTERAYYEGYEAGQDIAAVQDRPPRLTVVSPRPAPPQRGTLPPAG